MSRKTRQQGALERLENQLVLGTKTVNARGDKNVQVQIPLTDSDKKRIEREIATLKSKI